MTMAGAFVFFSNDVRAAFAVVEVGEVTTRVRGSLVREIKNKSTKRIPNEPTAVNNVLKCSPILCGMGESNPRHKFGKLAFYH